MELLTPNHPEWAARMLLRYGLDTTEELRRRAASMNPGNREGVLRMAERLESMGLRRLAEVPFAQLALITSE